MCMCVSVISTKFWLSNKPGGDVPHHRWDLCGPVHLCWLCVLCRSRKAASWQQCGHVNETHPARGCGEPRQTLGSQSEQLTHNHSAFNTNIHNTHTSAVLNQVGVVVKVATPRGHGSVDLSLKASGGLIIRHLGAWQRRGPERESIS